MGTQGLVADVTNGVINYSASSETTSKTTRGSSELGKDAFLELLVCQMQNQDPLDPQDNSEYVAQLAQFSSLEQLQNISGESQKSQALSMVGKYVIFKVTDAVGRTTYPEGKVDFVNMAGGKVKFSVDGKMFDYEDLFTVVDDVYQYEQNIPKIEKNYDLSFNAKNPDDLSFEVDFGIDDYKASEVAVVVGGRTIDGSMLSYRNNTVTIDKEAFKNFDNGEYPVSVIFNNSVYTTVTDKVSIKIYNSEYTELPAEDVAPTEA